MIYNYTFFQPELLPNETNFNIECYMGVQREETKRSSRVLQTSREVLNEALPRFEMTMRSRREYWVKRMEEVEGKMDEETGFRLKIWMVISLLISLSTVCGFSGIVGLGKGLGSRLLKTLIEGEHGDLSGSEDGIGHYVVAFRSFAMS